MGDAWMGASQQHVRERWAVVVVLVAGVRDASAAVGDLCHQFQHCHWRMRDRQAMVVSIGAIAQDAPAADGALCHQLRRCHWRV